MDRKYTVINEWGGEAAEAAARFKALSDEELISASNKGIFKRAVKDLEGCGEVRLTLSEDLVGFRADISFSDGEVTAGREIGDYSCNCPSKTVCRHIIGAALIIREFVNDNMSGGAEAGQLPENAREMGGGLRGETEVSQSTEFVEVPQEKLTEVDEGYLKEIIRTASGVLKKGIMNCGKFEQEAFMSLSLKGGREYGRIAANCRTASGDIEAMNERSPAFDPLKASLLAGRIINTAKVMLGERGSELLKKEGYTDRGDGYFIGLGAYPYRSKSGFAGITVLLYEKRLNEYFTYGCGLSDIYENTADAASEKSFKKQLMRHCHWQNDISLEMISGHLFRLTGYKADGKNRISSSKQTSCIVLEKTVSDCLPEELGELPQPLEYDYFSGGGGERFFVREIIAIEDVRFDTAGQTLRFTAVTPSGERLPAELFHSAVNDIAERFIEDNRERDLYGNAMVFRVSRREMIPVSLIGRGGVKNFFFK